jgi:predicted kinase
MMRTLMIFKGLPGSGKSTEAAALVKREPKRWIRINRDDLRGMVVGPGNNPHARDNDREELVRGMKEALMRQAFDAGYDVILDDTHLVPMTVKKLHAAAAAYGDVKVIERGVNVDIKTAIERDSKRTGFAHVGEKVIMDMARGAGIDKGRKLSDKEAYYEPRPDSFATIIQDESLPEAIMCDLDGTLAIINDRTPYDATDCDLKDLPNWPVIHCVLAMHARGAKIMFMSGRDQKYRPETERFIEMYCRVPANWAFSKENDDRPKDVPIPYELHMRGETAPDPDKMDMRKDAVIKQELFDKYVRGKYNVRFVLDDRNQVVDFWRSIGLTCFQVAPGAF